MFCCCYSNPALPSPMAISTWEARDVVTPQVQAELEGVLTRVLKLESRDARHALVKRIKAGSDLSDDTKTFLRLTAKREQEHFQFMTVLVPKVLPEISTDQPHDFSKDEFFYFAAASFFDGGVKSPEMKALVDSELRRHHELEAHHPEYEKYTEGECTDQDIAEMALDRLSRNAQFGDGVIRLDSMKRFLPTFTKGDVEQKQKLFWDCVEKYHSTVQKEFYDMFPETKDWEGHEIN